MANATAVTEASTTLLPPWPDELQSQVYILLTTVFFSLIILVGLFTNSLVLVTLARWPLEMRIPCNNSEDRYYCFPVFTKDQYRIAYQIYILVLFIAGFQCHAIQNRSK